MCQHICLCVTTSMCVLCMEQVNTLIQFNGYQTVEDTKDVLNLYFSSAAQNKEF